MINDNTSLEEFREMSCMTARCYNVCAEVGIKTFGDFMDHVFQMNHRNMGKNTFQEILSLKSKYKYERISCNSDIDWEQRRYKIAKEVFASIYDFTIERINFAKYAVDAADALIAELKKGGEK